MTTNTLIIQTQTPISKDIWIQILNEEGKDMNLAFSDFQDHEILQWEETLIILSFWSDSDSFEHWANKIYQRLKTHDTAISVEYFFDIPYECHGYWKNGNIQTEIFAEEKYYDFYEATNEDGYTALAITPNTVMNPTSFRIHIHADNEYEVAIVDSEEVQVYSPNYTEKKSGHLYTCVHPTEGTFLIMEHKNKFYSYDLEHCW
jgi:hypothetical protein